MHVCMSVSVREYNGCMVCHYAGLVQRSTCIVCKRIRNSMNYIRFLAGGRRQLCGRCIKKLGFCQVGNMAAAIDQLAL